MNLWKRLVRYVVTSTSDENFIHGIERVETLVSKLLSVAMIAVTVSSVFELCFFLGRELLLNDGFSEPERFFSVTLIKVFGLFLNVLIALELLENITGYLKKHVIQVELVIVTSLTAVARKIILFDFSKSTGIELIALAVASLALALSYWIVRQSNRQYPS